MKRATAVVLLLVLLFTLAACTQLTYPDEVRMMFRFLRFFENSSTVNVSVLQKYEVSEAEIYYYMEWSYSSDGDEAHKLLAVYDTQSTLVELAYFEDMESCYHANIQQVWDRLKTQEPDRTFTQAEIDEIVNEAAGLESV